MRYSLNYDTVAVQLYRDNLNNRRRLSTYNTLPYHTKHSVVLRANAQCNALRYDTIVGFNVDSKAEYTA